MTKKSTTSRKPRARKGSAPDAAAPSATAIPTPSPFTRDPRLPAVGTTLQRAYKGKVLEVTVREDGFEHEGATYRSLSQLARHVTGAASINGYLYFGLTGSKRSAASKPTKGTPEQVASVAKARAARAAQVAARKATKASS